MIKSINIRLYPTKEQISLMYKHIGSMRFVYNWALAKQMDNYKANSKKLSVTELGKELTILKNTEGYGWLYEVSNATLKESIRDLDKGYKNFFNGSGFPKFKSRKKSEPKFYSRYDNCLLYTSDAADDTPCVDLGGRRIIKKKKQESYNETSVEQDKESEYTMQCEYVECHRD
eukprot:TRINITY_DN6455_c0_g1_i2.p3 TRINITY_DN6455_c0_g1~~TRINITY_DN6455_c0_g1_i2.p3  ORF type:complete len:173 (-),score=14.94 TRINITY_DN6455_c0_g1_i2:34-552(-)